MELEFIGCGDALASGGRFNTCFHLLGDSCNLLLDCGATSLVALKRANVDLNAIDQILLTHFHADHAGGIPFFLLDAQASSHRQRDLVIAGPPGTDEWFGQALDAAFAGISAIAWNFKIEVRELQADEMTTLGSVSVLPKRVVHGAPDGPFFGYRLNIDGNTIAFSGDTQWTDALVELAHDADLFICELGSRDKPVPFHMDLATLETHLPEIAARKVIFTHLSNAMLNDSALPHDTACDGLKLELVKPV